MRSSEKKLYVSHPISLTVKMAPFLLIGCHVLQRGRWCSSWCIIIIISLFSWTLFVISLVAVVPAQIIKNLMMMMMMMIIIIIIIIVYFFRAQTENKFLIKTEVFYEEI